MAALSPGSANGPTFQCSMMRRSHTVIVFPMYPCSSSELLQTIYTHEGRFLVGKPDLTEGSLHLLQNSTDSDEAGDRCHGGYDAGYGGTRGAFPADHRQRRFGRRCLKGCRLCLHLSGWGGERSNLDCRGVRPLSLSRGSWTSGHRFAYGFLPMPYLQDEQTPPRDALAFSHRLVRSTSVGNLHPPVSAHGRRTRKRDCLKK